MIHLLKVTAFNVPRLIRAAGAILALLIALLHGWTAAHTTAPPYLTALLFLACAGAAIGGFALLAGARRCGWALAVTVSACCFASYIVTRTVGFPDFGAGDATWHDAMGTFSLVLEVTLVAVFVTIVTGRNVDVVGARDWDTYFSLPEPDRNADELAEVIR